MLDQVPQGALLKFGVVSAIEGVHVRVRFDDLDGLISAPFKVLYARTAQDRCHDLPKPGEPVACLTDSNIEFGVVVGCVYTDTNPPPSQDPDKVIREFADGARVEYDRNSGKLTLVTIGDADVTVGGKLVARVASTIDVTAGSSATVHAPHIILDAAQTTVTGRLNVEGLLTYLAGMAGFGSAGGSGASARIRGSVEIIGGDVTADGIGLKAHRHTEHDGYQTGPALP